MHNEHIFNWQRNRTYKTNKFIYMLWYRMQTVFFEYLGSQLYCFFFPDLCFNAQELPLPLLRNETFLFLFCQWGKDAGVAPADFFWITSTIGQQSNLSSRGRADFTLTFLNYSDWKWKMYVFVLNVHCSFKHSTCFVSLSCSWMHKSEIMPILIHINGYIAQSNSTLNNYSVFISAAI